MGLLLLLSLEVVYLQSPLQDTLEQCLNVRDSKLQFLGTDCTLGVGLSAAGL